MKTLFDIDTCLPIYDQCHIINSDITRVDFASIGKYGVIQADPPWQYEQGKALQGTVEEQYSVLTDADLFGLNVQAAAKDNCILLLWCTWPKLQIGLELISAWGFNYLTGFPWIKLSKNGNGLYYGVGFWTRGCSELILIARKGNVSPPKKEGWLGLISPNMQHSRKPEDLHEFAESLPGPYLELFARRPRDGWTVIGNELSGYLKSQGH